jgi:hypothetical protein
MHEPSLYKGICKVAGNVGGESDSNMGFVYTSPTIPIIENQVSENMQPRKINHIIEPQHVMEGAGVRLRRTFGPSVENHFDPFLLFDHFAFKDPVQGPISGFPTHPHRGIETVTYMTEGNMRHRDSLGNVDTIGPGEVQWMTSGRGILHEEMPRVGTEGTIDGFQLWVNLPSDQKMVQPRYQGVTLENIQIVENERYTARVVAGSFGGVRGPVTEIAADPLYVDITIHPGKEAELPIPIGHTAVAYAFEGEGWIGLDEEAEAEFVRAVKMIVFDDGDFVRVQAGAASHLRLMVIAGAPFREPIFPYGPFVMNTREEIIQAFDDLQKGTFIES